jgi:hypothetical protein
MTGARMIHWPGFRQFRALDVGQQNLFIKAWLMLGVMRMALVLVPFKYLSKHMQRHEVPPVTSSLSNNQLNVATDIGLRVAQAANHTPWQSRCLVQVLVAQRLLARRGIPGQLYLGVKKNTATAEAHAWLQCGERIVNGGGSQEQFKVVTSYSWSAQMSRMP